MYVPYGKSNWPIFSSSKVYWEAFATTGNHKRPLFSERVWPVPEQCTGAFSTRMLPILVTLAWLRCWLPHSNVWNSCYVNRYHSHSRCSCQKMKAQSAGLPCLTSATLFIPTSGCFIFDIWPQWPLSLKPRPRLCVAMRQAWLSQEPRDSSLS